MPVSRVVASKYKNTTTQGPTQAKIKIEKKSQKKCPLWFLMRFFLLDIGSRVFQQQRAESREQRAERGVERKRKERKKRD
jgi:hypothetical protein